MSKTSKTVGISFVISAILFIYLYFVLFPEDQRSSSLTWIIFLCTICFSVCALVVNANINKYKTINVKILTFNFFSLIFALISSFFIHMWVMSFFPNFPIGQREYKSSDFDFISLFKGLAFLCLLATTTFPLLTYYIYSSINKYLLPKPQTLTPIKSDINL